MCCYDKTSGGRPLNTTIIIGQYYLDRVLSKTDRALT